MRMILFQFIFMCASPTWGVAQILTEDNEDNEANNVNTTVKLRDDDAPNQSQSRIELEDAQIKNKSLADVLASVPGLSIFQAGAGQSSYAAIRGGNPRQNRVRWKGLKLTLPFGAGFDFSTLDPIAFDNIRVIRSGSSASKGSGALTGAVELGENSFPEGKKITLNSTNSSFGTLNLGLILKLKKAKDFAHLRLGLLKTKGDFPYIDRQNKMHIRLGNSVERVQLSATLGRQLSKKWLEKTSFLVVKNRRGAAGPAEFQETFSRAKNKIEQVYIAQVFDGHEIGTIFSKEVDLHFSLGFSGTDYLYTNPTALLGGGDFESLTEHRRVNGNTRARVFGEQSLTTIIFESAFENYKVERKKNSQHNFNKKSRVEYSLKGAREDYINDNVTVFTNAAVDFIDNIKFLPSANIGVFRALSDSFSLRFNGAYASRMPDLDELYLETESVRGNPNLNSEGAWTVDLGLSYTQEKINFQTTIYWSKITNTILFLPVSAFLIEAKNVSNFQSYGLENSIEILFPLTRFRLHYTLTLAQRNAIQSPHQPVHKGGASFSVELPFRNDVLKKINLFSDVFSRSEINLDIFGNLKNRSMIRWNGGIQSQIEIVSKFKVDIALGVKNILNDQRQEDFLQRPLSGRQVYFSSVVNF